MAIIIDHRFSSRLFSYDENRTIKYLIIGTFNPGHPTEVKFNDTERVQFDEIKKSKKYQEFQKIKNFYDRSKNRFWKVFDILNNPKFYDGDYEKINAFGLKFYKTKVKMDRNKTFERQLSFCKNNEIFITDLVKSIEPISFCKIYDNFSDTTIENSNPKWNTPEIKKMIHKYSIKKILVNFDFECKSTPNLNKQVKEIRHEFRDFDLEIIRIMSPSGAAGNSYLELKKNWEANIQLISPVSKK